MRTAHLYIFPPHPRDFLILLELLICLLVRVLLKHEEANDGIDNQQLFKVIVRPSSVPFGLANNQSLNPKL